MKKTFLLVFLFALLVACGAPPTNREGSTSTNMATNSSAPMVSMPSDAEVISREKSVWESLKSKDYDTFASQLAEDQLEVSEGGVADKGASVQSVKNVEFSEVNFSDWRVLTIDPDLVVTTYKVSVKAKEKDKELPLTDFRESSAWVNRDGKWKAIFHQGTRILNMPPPPAPAASPAKAASPAATTSAATATSDPVANEKIIWDLLRAKNYDGFAALLDPKAIEVNPYGVYDKEGILKSVQTFDASKAQLSEFRTVEIDRDAALVTYLVKVIGPKPEEERHSTIWANSDGKWMAVFHHGTAVMAKK
jgi:hypothetical protein